MAKTTLICDIEYDPALTDPESLASAMDRVMETALSTPDILEECGNPTVWEFLLVDENSPKPGPAIVADIHDSGARRRWVLYDLDSDCLLTTRTYDTYQEAADDASQANDVLILQVTIQGISG
jgi:hypothetical protein